MEMYNDRAQNGRLQIQRKRTQNLQSYDTIICSMFVTLKRKMGLLPSINLIWDRYERKAVLKEGKDSRYI